MLGAWTPGIPELVIILLIVMLLFGAKKLPEMAKSLGQSSKEFKKGLAEGHDGDDEDEDTDESSAKAKKAATSESDEKG